MGRVSKVFNVVCGLNKSKILNDYSTVAQVDYHGRVGHSVVDDSIHCDSDRVSGQDFLRRDIKCHGSEVYFLVMVNTGQDEEYTRTFSSTLSQSSKPEYDSSLILLYNLELE